MNVLDDPSRIASLDTHGMLGILERFPVDCADAVSLADASALPFPPHSIDRIVVCGMGGSAMGGEILRRFSLVPTDVSRGEKLPGSVNQRTLIVAISYSGDTEETLSAVGHGLESSAKLLCVTSGGRLAALARQRGLPLLLVPAGYPPRAALSYLGLLPLAILEKMGLAQTSGQWEAIRQSLVGDCGRFGPGVPVDSNPAKKLASALFGRVPVVVGSTGSSDLVALRWKTQFNENAKQTAFWSVLPELCHNEILGWENQALRKTLSAVLLRSQDDTQGEEARARFLAPYLTGLGVPVIALDAPGASPLERVLRLIYLGDFASVYLALLNGVDPTPIDTIDRLKRALR